MLNRRLWRRLPSLLTYLVVVVALALGILWVIPAPNYYLVFPGQAQQVSPMISVPGHRYLPRSGGLYDTYVNEFKASRLLYLLFGLVQSDVTVEPASSVSSGCSDSRYQQQLMAMMTDSKIQAEASALHVLGYKIRTEAGGPEIDQVSCNVPASKVLRTGDRIVGIDGHRVDSFDQVKMYTLRQRPGSFLRMSIRRAGKIKHVKVRTVHADKFGDILPTGGHAMIGIIMTMPLKFPVKVHINSGDVGGPSAGLAFALGIVQQLTHRNLTRGNKVAVTGAIRLVQVGRQAQLRGRGHSRRIQIGHPVYKAQVEEIGGARQKALAAEAAGAKYFLVPYPNYPDALAAHAHLKVIPVHTLKGALQVLHHLPPQGRPPSSGAG